MTAARRRKLLLAAAFSLDEGEDPFHGSFLSKHKVTLDEAYDLSELLAMGARMVLKSLEDLGRGGLAAQVAGMQIAEGLLVDLEG